MARPSQSTLEGMAKARTRQQVETLLAELPIVPVEEYHWGYEGPVGEWRPGQLHWIPVGRTRGNGGRIKLAGEPVNPIAERLINGMEALIELERRRELAQDPTRPPPSSPREAALRYFGLPPLDQIERMDAEEAQKVRASRDRLRARLRVVLNHAVLPKSSP